MTSHPGAAEGESHQFVGQGSLDICWHWLSGTVLDTYGGRYCRQNRAHQVHSAKASVATPPAEVEEQ